MCPLTKIVKGWECMVAMKRILAALLAALSILTCTGLACAESDPVGFDDPKTEMEFVSATDSTRIGDLKSQIEALYRRVGEELNIDYLYVKILHRGRKGDLCRFAAGYLYRSDPHLYAGSV